jgi:hypothetical protein
MSIVSIMSIVLKSGTKYIEFVRFSRYAPTIARFITLSKYRAGPKTVGAAVQDE